MNTVILKAGYAKVDVTPAYSVPLGGYGDSAERFHTHVLEPLCAACVAVSDGENTLLLFHIDQVAITTETCTQWREELAEKYGIPAEQILLNVTHSHSTPDIRCEIPEALRYKEELRQAILALPAPALEDLAEAKIHIASGEVKGWNFVRRELMADGTYAGDNFGTWKNNRILGHETEADHVMQAVRLTREGKKDILLVNWQAHPHPTGSADHLALSSDVVGRLRDTAEEEHGVHFAFFQGCGGNINSTTRIQSERISHDYRDIARGLADGLTKVLQTLRPVKSGPVRAVTKVFSAPVNHDWDDRVETAEKIVAYRQTHDHEETRAFAKENGFNSIYHANAVINRSKMPETLEYSIGAVSFGQVCIAWAPNELFDTAGKFLKETLPFEMSFACGYTNGAQSYMPTVRAFYHGGYGCDICNYAPGATEKLTMELLELGRKLDP